MGIDEPGDDCPSFAVELGKLAEPIGKCRRRTAPCDHPVTDGQSGVGNLANEVAAGGLVGDEASDAGDQQVAIKPGVGALPADLDCQVGAFWADGNTARAGDESRHLDVAPSTEAASPGCHRSAPDL